MSRLTSFAPLAIFAALAIALGVSARGSPGRTPEMLIDKAMPSFTLAAVDGEGGGLSSADLGGGVALLHVFASWCPVCRSEAPMIAQIAASGELPIYGVNWKDESPNAGRWLRERKIPYRRMGFDGDGKVGSDLGVTGVPETFVVDRTGRIRYRHPGAITQEVWRDTIEPLLIKLRSAQ
jgi:cytochrome c biogenesis protein CcmG, thiol:disulfide interchange protein DsbE